MAAHAPSRDFSTSFIVCFTPSISSFNSYLNVDSCVWRFEKLSSILFSIEFSLSMIILRDVEDSVSCSSTISSRFRFGVGAEFELELDDHSCRLDISVAAYIIYKVDYASTTTILCHKEEPNGLFQRFGYRAVERRPAAILQPSLTPDGSNRTTSSPGPRWLSKWRLVETLANSRSRVSKNIGDFNLFKMVKDIVFS